MKNDHLPKAEQIQPKNTDNLISIDCILCDKSFFSMIHSRCSSIFGHSFTRWLVFHFWYARNLDPFMVLKIDEKQSTDANASIQFHKQKMMIRNANSSHVLFEVGRLVGWSID